MQHNEAHPLEDVNRDQDAATLGQILRRAREAQGFTLEQICTELRFEPPVLEALEGDRLDELGPPVFAKGYLKLYGQRLGLAYEDLLARYYDAVGRDDVVIEPSRPIRLRDERQIAVWVVAAVVLMLIGVVLFVWWANNASEPAAFPPPAESTAPPLDDPAFAPLDEPAGAGPAPGLDPVPAEGARAPAEQPAPEDAGGAAVEPGAEPVERPLTAPADLPGPDTSEPARADVAPLAESVDNGAPPAAGGVRVELAFADDSWAEVSDASGERLVYGLGRAGERESVAGPGPLSVLLGNADAVRLVVDGEPFTIPAAARRGDVAEFTIGGSDN